MRSVPRQISGLAVGNVGILCEEFKVRSVVVQNVMLGYCAKCFWSDQVMLDTVRCVPIEVAGRAVDNEYFPGHKGSLIFDT